MKADAIKYAAIMLVLVIFAVAMLTLVSMTRDPNILGAGVAVGGILSVVAILAIWDGM